MTRIFSNGRASDYVINPFNRLLENSKRLHLAAPYFTLAGPVLEAAATGKTVQLLVGLNSATSPQALGNVHGLPGVAVRYLTHRFHAKIYIFDNTALLGSSNLTDGGLYSNREAVICLDQAGDDSDAVEEVRALFLELWDSAHVLTDEKLQAFAAAHRAARTKAPDPDVEIENAIGRAEPANINVASLTRSRERIFLEELRREVYEQYRPAFKEVTDVLATHGFRRPELADIGTANETNRFLNWVRLTYVQGDEAWRTASLRPQHERRTQIVQLGMEWTQTDNSKIPQDYADWLETVRRIFGSENAIDLASKEQITEGLLSLHAFSEQQRFVKGGLPNLPTAFWSDNNDDLAKVKASLTHLLHGPGDFIHRLHDTLYDPAVKLGRFGRFCALELFGTVKPEECPPMNGRMAKALRYLGYDVKGV